MPQPGPVIWKKCCKIRGDDDVAIGLVQLMWGGLDTFFKCVEEETGMGSPRRGEGWKTGDAE